MKKRLFYMLPVILMAMMGSCASENGTDENQSAQPTSRKLRKLTITQNGTTRSAVGTTRSILIDKGEEGIYASWEMGDELTVYNKTYPGAGYSTIKATSSTKTANFSGTVDCEVNDNLRFFYPSISEEGSVTESNGTLTLDISKQKGTLEDIQLHYDFNYGEATITAVTDETATGDAGLTEYISAICKFTFKCNKEYIKKISSVEISNVVPSATFTLSARNNPELNLSDVGKIDVTSNKVDNSVYVTLFPGATAPTFTVMASDGKYEGTISSSTLTAGKFYDVVVETIRTGEGTGDNTGGENGSGIDVNPSDYIEVCGVKWAKGNLQYDPVNGGDEGFMENWRIAPAQWHFVGYEKLPASPNLNTKIDISDEEINDNFYIGRLTEGKTLMPYNATIISGKLYAGNYFEETDSWVQATLGDLAYYRSNKRFRLPTLGELRILDQKASRQYGYYLTSNGIKIYGYFFTTPSGERIINTTVRIITDEEMEQGLFLPIAGFRSGNQLVFNSGSQYAAGSRDYFSGSVATQTVESCQTLQTPWTNTNYYFEISNSSNRIKIRPVLYERRIE